VFVVIFRARVADVDDEYLRTASRLRKLAREKYGCVEFVSVTEGEEEISLSYWRTREEIEGWKNDAEHLVAQRSGRERWYRWYEVQVAEITDRGASARGV